MARRRKRRVRPLRPADVAALTAMAAPGATTSWLLPQSGDLMRDVASLQTCVAREENPEIRSVFARAAIVMGVAAIEAVTNDALAAIFTLMTGEVPPHCAKTPPWRHFAGRSARRVALLLRHGKFASKRTYVLWQIERITGAVADDSLVQAMDCLRHARNRIVHTNYRLRAEGIEATDDAPAVAATAGDCARRYLEFLSEGFAAFALPLRAIERAVPAA